jgi:hypothetical protein
MKRWRMFGKVEGDKLSFRGERGGAGGAMKLKRSK